MSFEGVYSIFYVLLNIIYIYIFKYILTCGNLAGIPYPWSRDGSSAGAGSAHHGFVNPRG